MCAACLSDKRYEHTINVKKMAVKLAKHYGADEERRRWAALLHDAAKEIGKDEMVRHHAGAPGIRRGRGSAPHAGVARACARPFWPAPNGA